MSQTSNQVTRGEFAIIRILLGMAACVFGAIEIKGNYEFFGGMVAWMGIALLSLAFLIFAAVCILGHSDNRGIRKTVLRGEAISLPVTLAVVSVWYLAASSYEGARKIDAAYTKKMETYLPSKKEADGIYARDLDAYEKERASWDNCRGADLEGFRYKSMLMGNCGARPVRPEKGNTAYKPAIPEPTAPAQTAEDVAFWWKGMIRILNVAGLAVSVGILIRLTWIIGGGMKAEAKTDSNEKGKQESLETAPSESPLVAVSPSLSAEAEISEKCLNTEPVSEVSKVSNREVVLDTLPVSKVSDECQGLTLPVSSERKTTHICNKGYVLAPRQVNGQPKGWKVSYGVRLDKACSYICSATDQEVRAIIEASEDGGTRERVVEALLTKKGKMSTVSNVADLLEAKNRRLTG